MRMTVESMVEREIEKKKMWLNELRKMPEGSLYCVLRDGKTYHNHFVNGHRKGITGIEKVSAYRQGADYDNSQLILSFEKDIESSDLEDIIEQRIMPFM